MPDRGVAIRRAAGLVADLDKAAQPGREEPCAGLHRHEISRAGGGVEPPEPDVHGLVLLSVSGVVREEDLPRPPCGDYPVAGKPCGFAACLEQRTVGHDELDLDPGDPAGFSRDAFHKGVRHELPAGSGIPGVADGVGVPGERGVDRDALGDGEQGGEIAHGVRRRAEADVPFRSGMARPLGDGARIVAVGGGPGCGDQGPVPGTIERPGVGRELLVDGTPIRRR